MILRLLIILAAFAFFGFLAFNADAAAAAGTQPAVATPVEKDGLAVTLIADPAVLAKNEPVRFTIRFKNLTDKSMPLFDGAYFENWMIRLEGSAGRMPWRMQSSSSDKPRPARPSRELKPGETWEVTTRWGSNEFPFVYASELVLNMPIPPADALTPGRYKLWVGINFKKKQEADAAHLGLRSDFNVGPVEIEVADKDDPKGVQASSPLKISGAEFQTVARPQWLVPAAGTRSEVHLGLKIRNRSGRWMQVNTFDTVQWILTDQRGNEVPCSNSRPETKIPRPLLLQNLESQTFFCNGTIVWSPDGKSLELSGPDGAGGEWRFKNLKPGRYTAHIVLENDEERLKPVLEQPATHVLDLAQAPFWIGKATTDDLAVEIVEPPTTTGARSVAVKCLKADDEAAVHVEGEKTILSIRSRSGIGGAVVERGGKQWPDTMVLRIYLRGLESLSIAAGETTLRISVSSHDGNPRLLHLSRGREEGRQLGKDDPYYTELRALDSHGKAMDGLPEQGGWFELGIPKALLTDKDNTLALEWVDFFRG